MDEALNRLALVGGVAVVALIVAWWMRRRPEHPIRSVSAGSLAPGVYLFTSATCASCAEARATVRSRLGEDGYTELTWEGSPSIFSDLRIEAVPAVLIVTDAGRGRLFPGRTEEALASL